MAKFVAPGRLMIKDDNLDLQNPKNAVSNVKSKISKTNGKKGGSGMGGRKALNDITNKKSIQPEASSRKKNLPKEEINIKEEMFSHNHTKCIESQKAAMVNFNLEAVLPPDGSRFPSMLPRTSGTANVRFFCLVGQSKAVELSSSFSIIT
ncbi:protein PATRONUS 2 isoform X2 [Trifolium pratense]|uniref:protein PATRONUS 2 isoform X2 n=1 Tax=Trifolium pratense TaxID=57577 RepID=UPI001E693CD3|nr:protein PATRONUS 2 isoform X2 [Trifolium pratense]